MEAITDSIYGYFEDVVNGEGAKDWDDFVKKGFCRFPEDKYLWDLSIKLSEKDYNFTETEISKLKVMVLKIKNMAYPDYLKEALTSLSIKLQKV
jgi:hypothetical protein